MKKKKKKMYSILLVTKENEVKNHIETLLLT